MIDEIFFCYIHICYIAVANMTMKNISTILLGVLIMFSAVVMKAQTFTVAQDTMSVTVAKTAIPDDNITNKTDSNITLLWHVTATNFPADWLTAAAFGICDNHVCRSNGSNVLWNATTTTGTTYTSTYHANSTHDSEDVFGLSLDLSGVASLGTHWVTINIQHPATSYSKNITFLINKIATGIPSVTHASNEIVLYPNPAHDELNIVYDESADIKNVAVYNIIGKVMTIYKVAGNSANLNLENIPSGIYFIRLVNSKGNVVGTRKFTKQ